MPGKDFWSVELGRGMGPLVFGQPRHQVIQILREHGFDGEIGEEDEDSELYIAEMKSILVFSAEKAGDLKRLEIDDERLRFGPMQVHGKPVHEIVQLLNVPSSETLWCDFFDDEQPQKLIKPVKSKTDHELLRFGTLWITSLGLGMSLDRGKIESVHLCDPMDSPKFGDGHWTTEQQRLSEAGIVDEVAKSTSTTRTPLAKVLLLGVTVAMVWLVWNAIHLQQKWNNAPDVSAKIMATTPPPPEPFPDTYTVSYVDFTGDEHQAVFRAVDVYGLPAIGDEINIRFLPDAPQQPLSHARYRDVGFDFAVPYGIAIFGSYWTLKLIMAIVPLIRFKKISEK